MSMDGKAETGEFRFWMT